MENVEEITRNIVLEIEREGFTLQEINEIISRNKKIFFEDRRRKFYEIMNNLKIGMSIIYCVYGEKTGDQVLESLFG